MNAPSNPARYGLHKAAYRMSEWLKISPVSRTATYQDIAAGKLRAVKRGHSTLILAVDGAAYFASLPEWTSSPANARSQTADTDEARRQ